MKIKARRNKLSPRNYFNSNLFCVCSGRVRLVFFRIFPYICLVWSLSQLDSWMIMTMAQCKDQNQDIVDGGMRSRPSESVLQMENEFYASVVRQWHAHNSSCNSKGYKCTQPERSPLPLPLYRPIYTLLYRILLLRLLQWMTEINYQLELQLKWSVGSWELRADCHSTGDQHANTHSPTHKHTHSHTHTRGSTSCKAIFDYVSLLGDLSIKCRQVAKVIYTRLTAPQ